LPELFVRKISTLKIGSFGIGRALLRDLRPVLLAGALCQEDLHIENRLEELDDAEDAGGAGGGARHAAAATRQQPVRIFEL